MTEIFTEDEIVRAAMSLPGTPEVYARKILKHAIEQRMPVITDDTMVTFGELKKASGKWRGTKGGKPTEIFTEDELVKELVKMIVREREPQYVTGRVYRTADGQYVKFYGGGWLTYGFVGKLTDAQLTFPLTEAP